MKKLLNIFIIILLLALAGSAFAYRPQRTLDTASMPATTFPDDTAAIFGTSSDFCLEYDSSNGYLQLGDCSNDFLRVTDDGTTATFAFLGNGSFSGNFYAATYGSDSSITDAELKTLDDGAVTEILVGGGAGSAPTWGTDIPTAVTIGSAYVYRVSGTDVAIADGGTGAGTATAGFDALSPMTTIGDIIYGGASGTGTRLGAGAEGTLLMGNGAAAPSWLGAGTSGYYLIAAGASDPVWTQQADLAALEALSGTGLIARTGAATYSERTITGTASQVIVSNGNGVSGNPTLSTPQDIATDSSPQFLGKPPLTKTDDYTVTTSDLGKSLRMNTASDKAFTLPSVGATEDGGRITFIKQGAGKMTVIAVDSDTIDDSSAAGTIYTTTLYATITLEYVHGMTRWVIISANGTMTTT